MLASARWLTVLRGRGGGRDNSQRLGLSLTTCVHDRRGRVETPHTAPGEVLLKRRRTRVRFPPPPQLKAPNLPRFGAFCYVTGRESPALAHAMLGARARPMHSTVVRL